MGRRSAVAAAPGFTLLEVILTLALIGIALAVTIPTLGRTVDTVRARADVAGFAAVFRHAREQAISTRVPHAVIVEPAAHRVSVHVGDEVRLARALPARVVVEVPRNDVVRFEPHGASSGGEFRLVAGTLVYRVTVDTVTGRVRSRRE